MFYGGKRGTIHIVLSSICLLLASVTVLLRLVVRLAILKTFGIDDALICAAWAASVAFLGFLVLEVYHGQGLQDSLLPRQDLLDLRHTLWMSIPCYIIAQAFTNLSILSFYWRFFQGKVVRRITIALIALVTSSCLFGVFATAFMCTPVASFWDPSIAGHCLDREPVWFVVSGTTLVTDIIVLLIPMPVLYKLRLPKRRRFELMSVFALGGIACAISVARQCAIAAITKSQDVARYNGLAAMMSSIEVNVGVICASLPVLRSTAVRVISQTWPRSSKQGFDEIDCPVRRREEQDHLTSLPQSCISQNMMITKSVTITTMDERRRSVPRLNVPWNHGGEIWDGGGTSRSWVNINRRSSTPSMA